jgi:hypothetical protein
MVTKSKAKNMVTKSKAKSMATKKGDIGIPFTKIPLYLRNKIKQFKKLTKDDIINLSLSGLTVASIIAIIIKINKRWKQQNLITEENKIKNLKAKGYSTKEIDTLLREEEREITRRREVINRMNHEKDLARSIFLNKK